MIKFKIALAAAALLIAGCGVSGGEVADTTAAADPPTSTTTEATTTTTEAVTTTRPPRPTTTTTAAYSHDLETKTYLSVVRDHSTFLEIQSDDNLIGLALATCGIFDAGGDAYDVISTILASDSTEEQQGDYTFASGAGTAAFCPEWSWKWEEF